METSVNIFWLSGSYYARRQTVADIKSAVGEHEFFVYDENTTLEHVLNQTTGSPLFSSKKIVVLNGFPINEGKNKSKNLASLIYNISPNCYLIFNNISTTGLSKFYEEVKKIGKVIEFPQFLDRKKAANWLFARFRENGKKIEGEEVELILNGMVFVPKKGVDIDRLYICVKKICDFCGKKEKIERSDITKSSDKYNNFIIWDLMDFIDKKDLNACFRNILLASKTEGLKEISIQVLNVMGWRLKMLLLIKELQAKKNNDSQIMAYLQNNIHKLTKSDGYKLEKDENQKPKALYSAGIITGALKGFYEKEASIKHYTRRELYRGLACLSECISDSRNNIDEVEIGLLVDVLLLTMLKPEIPDEWLNKIRRPYCD